MPLTSRQLDIVRQEIAECLGVELDEVTPEANFFEDLGGESIDLLDLSFRIEKTLGIRPDFSSVRDQLNLAADENGALTPESVERLRSAFPEIAPLPEGPVTAKGLFTISVIEALIGRVAANQAEPLM